MGKDNANILGQVPWKQAGDGDPSSFVRVSDQLEMELVTGGAKEQELKQWLRHLACDLTAG